MLCTLLGSVAGLLLSRSPIDDVGRVRRIYFGHWCILLMFVGMILLHGRRSAWVVLDYIWGVYLLWCAWQALKVKGLGEDAPLELLIRS